MPDEGEYFTKSMFRYTSAVPPLKYLKLFIAGDLAIGENQQNDYTVLSVGGLDYEDQIYVFDLLRFKGDTYKIASAVMSLAKKYSPEQVGLEKGQLELAIKPILAKMMRKERFFIPLAEGKDALVPVTDKLKRARPLQGRMQQGMVYFLDTQPWLEAVQYELLRFPGGVHDDIVDSLAWLVRMIMNHEPPAKPGAKSKHKSWRDNLNAQLRGSARNPMLA